MDRVILIDAYSQIFRAFFAVQHLTNSRGEPTNALYVFTKLLHKIEELYPSQYGAMCFDCGDVGFRIKLNPEYKANRPPMPDNLRRQIPLIRQMAAAFGWNIVECPDYEADDLIGGFARAVDSPVLILSADKDLSQLIDERVTMIIPDKAGSFLQRGVDEVLEKFAVKPELMVDYLALLGDASDNIQGVNGIGPKGASELLNTYGPAENWMHDLSKLQDTRFYEKLKANIKILQRNRELIRLKTELPPQYLDCEKTLHRRTPDWAEIQRLCLDNDLKTIAKSLPGYQTAAAPATVTGEDDLFAGLTPAAKPVKPAAVGSPEIEMVQGELFF